MYVCEGVCVWRGSILFFLKWFDHIADTNKMQKNPPWNQDW